MLGKTHYANGQQVWSLENNRLTYYYKSGNLKAEGSYENEKMQGEWKFYHETGRLLQIGHFKDNQKHGSWIRYNSDGNIEYEEVFTEGKVIKNKNKR